jgi:O-antigen/teichoic acid export membrane protein
MINAVTTAGTRIVAGATGYTGAMAMVATNTLGSLCAMLYQSYTIARRVDLVLLRKTISVTSIRQIAHTYVELPKYNAPASFINSISWQLPVLMLTSLFSASVAGQYALSFRIIQIPMSLIGNSIGKVFYQRASIAVHNGTLKQLTEGTFGILTKIGLPIVLLLAFAGQDLFVFVYGEDWADAGRYTQFLAIWAFFWFIASPIGTLVYVLNLQRFNIIWNIFNFVFRISALWFGAIIGSADVAIALYGVSGAVIYLIACLYTTRKAGMPTSHFFGLLGATLAKSSPSLIAFLLLRYLGAPTVVVLVVPSFLVCLTLILTLRNEPQFTQIFGRLEARLKNRGDNAQ